MRRLSNVPVPTMMESTSKVRLFGGDLEGERGNGFGQWRVEKCGGWGYLTVETWSFMGSLCNILGCDEVNGSTDGLEYIPKKEFKRGVDCEDVKMVKSHSLNDGCPTNLIGEVSGLPETSMEGFVIVRNFKAGLLADILQNGREIGSKAIFTKWRSSEMGPENEFLPSARVSSEGDSGEVAQRIGWFPRVEYIGVGALDGGVSMEVKGAIGMATGKLRNGVEARGVGKSWGDREKER
ncbi:hypothetical protein Acr_05g0000690 [Actinidia rufa]|uniref:Uncharacterized protein n=1 Tax=Actinidia rufa TaxID=165716 RepID=A0A7J0EJ61_9ERIC|nr:hypothetical protein Acr_05g0000690 [Actinidia rufa]